MSMYCDTCMGIILPYQQDVKLNHTMNDTNRGTVSCRKVFVQRDYSEGTNVKFQTKFPQELDGLIDKQTFEHMITTLNSIYAEAEKMSGRTVCEGCLACLTAYLLYVCIDTHYEKCLKSIADFIEEQNERVWMPKGLLLTDPVERGLRVVEISILNEPSARS
ncbi:golgin subfamily A member 7-like isoform X3 [Tachypleus tridentatus]|uniref:golgin subfamily A member 7-like isoform X3 n=1 Tax=Tachypleus tridentatus TaxID=6853 RepID=UPI003FD18462